MDKEYFINLTNDLYRLTLLFPKKEPLKYKMRDLADNILAGIIMILESDEKKYSDFVYEVKKNIHPLDGFCELAKKQNWVSKDDVSDIQERYGVIKEEIEKFEKGLVQEKIVRSDPVFATNELNPRQIKILELLKNRDKMQVNEVQASFPSITKRTLRRDFDALTKKGIVERMGKANMTFYKLADKES